MPTVMTCAWFPLKFIKPSFLHHRHDQPQYAGTEMDAPRIKGKGAEPVGDMGICFHPGFMAVFCVDDFHCLALARSGEELLIAGRGEKNDGVGRHAFKRAKDGLLDLN